MNKAKEQYIRLKAMAEELLLLEEPDPQFMIYVIETLIKLLGLALGIKEDTENS